MKKFIFLFILILFSILLAQIEAKCQKTLSQRVNDSIEQALGVAKSRVDSLEIILSAAEKYLLINTEYFEPLIVKASRFNIHQDPVSFSRIKILEGKIAGLHGDYNKSLDLFKKAMVSASVNKLPEYLLEAKYLYAETLFIIGKSSAAEKLLNEILKDSKPLINPELRSKVYLGLSKIAYFNGSPQKALEYCNLGINTCGKACKSKIKTDLIIHQGDIYFESGNKVNAITAYVAAKQLASESNLLKQKAVAENSIGEVYYSLDQFKLATGYFEKALIIYDELQDNEGTADSYNNLGSAWLYLNNYGKAYAYYLKAQEIWASVKDSSGISTTYNNLAEYYLKTGNIEQARVEIAKSVNLDKSLNDEIGLIDSYQTTGAIELAAGNITGALSNLIKSELLATRLNFKSKQVFIFRDLSKVYEKQGRFREAFDYQHKYYALRDTFFSQDVIQKVIEIGLSDTTNFLISDSLQLAGGEKNVILKENELRKLTIDLRFYQGLIIFLVVIIIISVSYFFILKRKNNIAESENEELLHKLNEAANASKLAIEKANAADKQQENFLHCMTHELRTPLNGIIGFASILEEDVNDFNSKTMARAIGQSGTRLLATLNGLLELSAIEDNIIEIEYTDFAIKDVLFHCIEKYSREARIKGLGLDLKCEQRDIKVRSDYALLDKVFSYLIDNAIKYTATGYIQLFSGSKLMKGSEWAVIKVVDTGIGIPEDQIDLIFANFRQASEGFTRDFEGPGIGLSLTRNIVSILGGFIDVNSSPGKGSVFTVFIPALNESVANAPLTSPFINKSLSNGKKPLLLVEDDETNREFAAYTLSNYFDIDLALDGKSALQMAVNRHYSIILMDINLGRDLSGSDVVNILRSRKEYIDTPIAAITANARKDHRDLLLKSGFTHFLAKPYTKSELKALVRNMTGKSSGQL